MKFPVDAPEHAPGPPARGSHASAGHSAGHSVGAVAGERRPGADDHDATRTRVVRSLIDQGPATTTSLAARLGLTAGAVRRHLESLTAAGMVQADDEPPYGPRAPRGRGRPAKVYSVTEAGRSTGTSGDAGLAREVLRHLRASLGDEGVRAFAESRLDAQRDRFSVALAEVPLEDRARELARLLTDEGYAASVEEVPGTAIGIQICQHDCPVAQVAAEFPELCDAESRMFAEVLGTHIQRLATIAHGDGVCTTHMPAVLAAAQLSAAQATGSEAESPISAAGPRTRDSDSRSTPFRPLDRSTP